MKESVATSKYVLMGGLVILLSLCFSTFSSAQEQDTWQSEISIYGWYAGIDGAIEFPRGNGPDVSVDASDIIEDLSLVLMGNYEGRYNRWSVIADVVYMDVGDGTNLPGTGGTAGIDLDLKTWILTGAVGYDVVQSTSGTFGFVGGVRYLALDADVELELLDVQVTEKSASEGMADGILGMRGYFQLSDNWYIPYHADIGAGSSDLTWQLYGAIGYRFSWGDIRLGYRHLSYDLGDDKLMQDLELSGPVLGVGFRF
jgi:hypothetical protein